MRQASGTPFPMPAFFAGLPTETKSVVARVYARTYKSGIPKTCFLKTICKNLQATPQECLQERFFSYLCGDTGDGGSPQPVDS